MNSDKRNSYVVGAMYVGLVLTVLVALIPLGDHVAGNVLADHIAAGYPSYSQREIDSAASMYLVLLSIVGALGIVGWLVGVRAAVRWPRAVAGSVTTLLLVAAVGVALTGMFVPDTSGDTGLPLSLSWWLLLPCVPGLYAVAQLWTARRPAEQRQLA